MSVDRERLLNIARSFDIVGDEADALVDDNLTMFRLNDFGATGSEAWLEWLVTAACIRRRAAAVVAGLDPVRLREILPSLPAHTRRVLQLHAFHGLDAHGVAQLLDIPPVYAAKLIEQAVERAKELIEQR
ncbi:MAG TPA: hypothetical protein VGF28_09145 [Thermoanaerobaculia bacterium]